MRFFAGVCVGFLLGVGAFVWLAETGPHAHTALDALRRDFHNYQLSRAQDVLRRDRVTDVGEE